MVKTLEPSSDVLPTLDCVFTSKIPKTYHVPNGVSEYNINLPYNQNIPEKLFICFQSYDTFDTRDFKYNGLYLDHLNISQVNININGSTIYNTKSDFDKGNCAKLYFNLLMAIGKDNVVSYDNFKSGMTLLSFSLANFDSCGDI